MKRLSGLLFKTQKTRSVVRPEEAGGALEPQERLLLLDIEASQDLPQQVMDALQPLEATVMSFGVTLDYDDLTAEQVLRRIMPAGVEAPSSFESVGHVAHLNLRPEALPVKHLIGQVLIDKNPRIRTVVNKVSTIETQFRTFPLEVLAGDPCLDVEHKESGATFNFNFAEVYWNSRLQGEHDRVISAIPPGAVVWDVFAGVGPFSVPLAMKGCRVFANDLNDRSFHYLTLNAQRNKVTRRLEAHNLDGRTFVETLTARQTPVEHVIMNLPNSSIEFLDVFIGRLEYLAQPPLVHLYSFSKEDDPARDVIERAARALGVERLVVEEAHQVRDVAPKKWMMCIAFRLPTQR